MPLDLVLAEQAVGGLFNVQIDFLQQANLAVAPLPVFAGVTVTGTDVDRPASDTVHDPQWNAMEVIWTITGDSYSYEACENVEPQFKNADVMYGPQIARFIRTPGTVTFRADVYALVSGVLSHAFATRQLTAADANSIFAGSDTFYVSRASSFGNAPSGSTTFTSYSAALAAAMGSTDPKRIMLQRGEDHPETGYGFGGTVLPSIYTVAEPQAGPRPRFSNVTSGFTWNDTNNGGSGADKDWIYQGIDFEGPWDSTTETGSDVTCLSAQDKSPNIIGIDQCGFTGFGGAYAPTTNLSLHRSMLLSDSLITNWKTFGIIDAGFENQGLVGSKIAQDLDALAGKTDLSGNNNGPVRNAGIFKRCSAHAMDFLSRNSFSQRSASPPIQTYQPCYRFNTDGNAGPKLNMQASAFESGISAIEAIAEPTETAEPHTMLVERIYAIGDGSTQIAVKSDSGGLTMRNSKVNNAPHHQIGVVGSMSSFVGMESVRASAGALAAPIRIYSNTYRDGMIDENDQYNDTPPPIISGSGAYGEVIVENNALIRDLRDTPVTADGPFDMSDQWLVKQLGYVSSLQALMPETRAPHFQIAVNVSAPFAEGETITSAGGSGTVSFVTGNNTNGGSAILWVAGVTGTFSNGETITGGGSGAGTASANQADATTSALLDPLPGAGVLEDYTTGLVSALDFYGNVKADVLTSTGRSAEARGATEPV